MGVLQYRPHGLHLYQSDPPIMNRPLKGQFIYWGFVIPMPVKRPFKRRLQD